MKTATVKMFKERPNGDLSEFIIELTIPSRRRYGAVIREYIEYYNAKNFAKIYFYEVLKLETSKNQRGVNGMNELERTALNEVLRTVRLINEKVAEIGELQSQQELAISYLRGIMDSSEIGQFYLGFAG